MPTHYFDHAATTPLDAEVLATMMPYLTTIYGNASSPHAMGQASHSALDRARDDVAAVLGCSVSEVVFTAGGSEGDNLAVKGAAFAHQQAHGSAHVIVSAVEHHAVLHAAEALTRHGIAVTVLPVDGDGMVQVDAVAAAIRPDTALVSVMYATTKSAPSSRLQRLLPCVVPVVCCVTPMRCRPLDSSTSTCTISV